MQHKTTVAVVVGTRPELIKMAPVYNALATRRLRPVLVSTGQQRELLADALSSFGLKPAADLAVMSPGQSPQEVAARILAQLPPVFMEHDVGAVLVQGDTTTAFAAAYAAYVMKLPVGHVEAGLRTYDHENPFPEEGHRQMIARLATWSFAPTSLAAANLLREGIPADRVFVTGNTAIDSLMGVLGEGAPPRAGHLLVTLHRRESFGSHLLQLCGAVADFLCEQPLATVLWPVHPNPAVRSVVELQFGAEPRVRLCEPLDYRAFVAAMAGARVILSDSGGVQEEAPSLGKRVLIARDQTERPEALESGQNVLVGRDRAVVMRALLDAWSDAPYTGPLPAPSPFGDGRAAYRIVERLEQDLSRVKELP
jgi:UDP-N-acetylglucosamine 2-epimerase (non-hydrolysing)